MLFRGWYLTYVLLSDYAHGFMDTEVIGNVNLGILLGLGQSVSTFAITMLSVRYTDTSLDPLATEIRERVEGATGRGADR